jgi:hypothetical protein
MHLLSLGVPVVLGIVGLTMELYTPNGLGFQRCYIGTYPPGCDQMPGVECYRGNEKSTLLQLWFSIYLAAPAYSLVAIFTVLIYWTTRQEYRRSSANDRNSVLNSARETRRQSLAYGIMSFNSFIWICIPVRIQKSVHGITPEELLNIIYPLQVLAVVFWPLQGFFNMIIFTRPRFVRLRHLCQDESIWWVLKETIFGVPVNDRRYAAERMRKAMENSREAARQSSSNSQSLGATSIDAENSASFCREDVEICEEGPGSNATIADPHPSQQQALETVEETIESQDEGKPAGSNDMTHFDESSVLDESIVYEA